MKVDGGVADETVKDYEPRLLLDLACKISKQ